MNNIIQISTVCLMCTACYIVLLELPVCGAASEDDSFMLNVTQLVIITCHTYVYSGTSLLRTLLG